MFSNFHTAERVYFLLMSHVSLFGDIFAIQPAFFSPPKNISVAEHYTPGNVAPATNTLNISRAGQALELHQNYSRTNTVHVVYPDQRVSHVQPQNKPVHLSVSAYVAPEDWEAIDVSADSLLIPPATACNTEASSVVPFPVKKANYMQSDICVVSNEYSAESSSQPVTSNSCSMSEKDLDALFGQKTNALKKEQIGDWRNFLMDHATTKQV